MDALPRLADEIKRGGWGRDHLLGLLHVLIGRRITRKADGEVVSTGATWRELAGLLKKFRWDPEAARELGLDPKYLPPRDRERYWYVAILKSGVDSPAAAAAGERFVAELRAHGYEVGPAPGSKDAESLGRPSPST